MATKKTENKDPQRARDAGECGLTHVTTMEKVLTETKPKEKVKQMALMRTE